LTDLEIEHGPIDELRRFFSFADTLNRAQGVTLSFATLQELQAVNEANRESWKPLFPVFNPDMNTVRTEDAFCLLGRNSDGEVVSAQAARLFDWAGTNLKREAESLRWFYDDPEANKRPGEGCVVTAPSAPKITGRVAFLGAVWYRPDYRKRMPTLTDLRIGPYYALAKWRPDYFILVMVESLATKGLAPKFGREPEWEVLFSNNISFGDARLALLQSSHDEGSLAFRNFMDGNRSEIESVLTRAAG